MRPLFFFLFLLCFSSTESHSQADSVVISLQGGAYVPGNYAPGDSLFEAQLIVDLSEGNEADSFHLVVQDITTNEILLNTYFGRHETEITQLIQNQITITIPAFSPIHPRRYTFEMYRANGTFIRQFEKEF